MKRGPVIRFFEWLEKRLYRSADRIIVVTDAFKEKIAGRGIDSKKIAVFKNGVNLEYFKPGEKDPILVNKLGLKDKFIVGYIGTHGMAHGLDFILESIKGLEIKAPGASFFICR